MEWNGSPNAGIQLASFQTDGFWYVRGANICFVYLIHIWNQCWKLSCLKLKQQQHCLTSFAQWGFYSSSETFAETCRSAVLDSCFLLPRELCFDLDGRLCRFSVCSWMLVSFTLDGSSGGASGHGVRLAGTVTSKGGSIIHLKQNWSIHGLLIETEDL